MLHKKVLEEKGWIFWESEGKLVANHKEFGSHRANTLKILRSICSEFHKNELQNV